MRHFKLAANIFVVGMCAAAVGCAPGRDPAQVTDADVTRFKVSRDNVEVAVDPWIRGADMRSLFHHLPDRPVFVLRLIVANRGEDVIRFSNTSCHLADDSGQALPLLTQGEVNARTFDDGAGTAMLITIGTLGYGGLLAGAVMSNSAKDNLHDQLATRKLSMDLVLIDPSKVLSGFLFFDDVQAGVLRRRGPVHLTLEINRMLRSGNQPISHIEIPFTVDP
jgi:hypothetical protein